MDNLDSKFMLAAIEHVKKHVCGNEGGPFGACIVQNDKIISLAHNTVLKDKNPISHAEINAINLAVKHLNRIELNDCVIYSTTEPCPMCFSAIHWAGIAHIVYGTQIEDVKKLGFRELDISNTTMKELGHSEVKISQNFEKTACESLLNYWQQHSRQQIY